VLPRVGKARGDPRGPCLHASTRGQKTRGREIAELDDRSSNRRDDRQIADLHPLKFQDSPRIPETYEIRSCLRSSPIPAVRSQAQEGCAKAASGVRRPRKANREEIVTEKCNDSIDLRFSVDFVWTLGSRSGKFQPWPTPTPPAPPPPPPPRPNGPTWWPNRGPRAVARLTGVRRPHTKPADGRSATLERPNWPWRKTGRSRGLVGAGYPAPTSRTRARDIPRPCHWFHATGREDRTRQETTGDRTGREDRDRTRDRTRQETGQDARTGDRTRGQDARTGRDRRQDARQDARTGTGPVLCKRDLTPVVPMLYLEQRQEIRRAEEARRTRGFDLM
jgi:hypothetical protein